MGLPREFQGVWRRISLSIRGQPAFEDSEVIWLQTQEFFADLRTASCINTTCVVSAFSGRASWQPPEIRFHRDLDLAPSPVEDRAELQSLGEHLVEHGVFRHGNRLVPYKETWVRCRGPQGLRWVLDGSTDGCDGPPSMRWVDIGGVALALLDERPAGGEFTAVQFMDDAGKWREVRRIGNAAIKPPPQALQATLQSSILGVPVDVPSDDPIWGARTWILREQSHDDEHEGQ